MGKLKKISSVDQILKTDDVKKVEADSVFYALRYLNPVHT